MNPLSTFCRMALVCAAISLLSYGLAQAQEPEANQNYGAVATSIVLFEGHYGFADLLGSGDDLRLRVSVTPPAEFNLSNASIFGMGAAAEALYELGNSSFYGGGGLSTGFGGFEGINIAAVGTVGYEFPLDSVSLITELGTGIGFSFGYVGSTGGGIYAPLRAIVGVKFDL